MDTHSEWSTSVATGNPNPVTSISNSLVYPG